MASHVWQFNPILFSGRCRYSPPRGTQAWVELRRHTAIETVTKLKGIFVSWTEIDEPSQTETPGLELDLTLCDLLEDPIEVDVLTEIACLNTGSGSQLFRQEEPEQIDPNLYVLSSSSPVGDDGTKLKGMITEAIPSIANISSIIHVNMARGSG